MSEDTTSARAEESGLARITVTDEQFDLIRRTIAKDATPEELALYLFDCKRRGVHPLDKLIHFTKRGGKYTPVTSIDFFRSRAAETGDYAGNDDYVFRGTPGKDDFAATATVYRFCHGERVAFIATARWSEYYPGDQGGIGFMWKKMPHVMLGKSAEGVAFRKGFPQELSGLYTVEELDQAIEAPPPARRPVTPRVKPLEPPADVDLDTGELREMGDEDEHEDEDEGEGDTIKTVQEKTAKNGKPFFLVKFASGRTALTFSETLAQECRLLAGERKRVWPVLTSTPGFDLPKLEEVR